MDLDDETAEEFRQRLVRRFLTVLFIMRARRHVKAVAEAFGMPERQQEYEAQFIKDAELVPHFADKSKQQS
jgi:hypothetical protein